jgi:hypothetical protein
MDQETIDLLVEENLRLKADVSRLSKEKIELTTACIYVHDAIVDHLRDADERLPRALVALRTAGIGSPSSNICAFCGEEVQETIDGANSDYCYKCANEACQMFGKAFESDMELPPWCL